MASHRRRMSHFIAIQKAGFTHAELDDQMERPLPTNWYGRPGCQCQAHPPCHTLHTRSMPAALHAYCEGAVDWHYPDILVVAHCGWASADKASWILSELYFIIYAHICAYMHIFVHIFMYMYISMYLSVPIYVPVRAQIRPETRTLIHTTTYPKLRTKIHTSDTTMAWA